MICPSRKAQRLMEHCEKSANISLEINIVCYAILFHTLLDSLNLSIFIDKNVGGYLY